MSKAEPRHTPDPTLTGYPPGIPYIIGNELAERFSFYGMKAILTVFMTKHLLDASGSGAYMSDEEAKTWYHGFTAAAYFFPIIGAFISDALWGKYRTILFISLMYCVGHGLLALMDLGPVTGLWDMKPLLLAGLLLIAVGAGGIKPCVSAHVGDQFGRGNANLLTKIFNWFYLSINLGAAASSFLTPLLLKHYGPGLAFGLPGVLMAVATFIFWMGRDKFVHVPPSGIETFKRETFSPAGVTALKNLAPLFLIFIPMFWAIFDQTGSAWVLQAEHMDRQFLGIEWLESQVQVVNPVLILILIPTFTWVVYPLMGKFFEPTPLRKIGIGLFMTAGAFAISGWIETRVQMVPPVPDASYLADVLYRFLGQLSAGADPNAVTAAVADRVSNEALWWIDRIAAGPRASIGWQFLAYLVLTAAEVLVSIVSLEFAYTQAPNKMKSFIMGVYFLGVSLGNQFTALVNWIVGKMKAADGTSALDGANYYWFFTGLMLLTAFAYVVFARLYKGQTFVQGDDESLDHAQAVAEAPDAR